MLQDGKPWSKYREQFIETYNTFHFCKVFGWTPEEVRGLKDNDYDTFLSFKSLLKGLGDADNGRDKS